MAAAAISRWVLLAIRWMPGRLHRALDAWSLRRAEARRLQRRLHLKARQPT